MYCWMTAPIIIVLFTLAILYKTEDVENLTSK